MNAPAHFPKTGRAFSLLELLIVIALFALILAALVTIVIGHYDIYRSQQATVDVSYSARAVVHEVTMAARQANRVTLSHNFSGVDYTTGTSTVVFQLPAVDGAGNTIPGAYDYIAIAGAGTTAYRLTDAASGSARAPGTRQLSDTLSTLTFTYDSGNPTETTKIIVDVETAKQVKNETIGARLNQQVYLRNF